MAGAVFLGCFFTGCAVAPPAGNGNPLIVKADLDDLWRLCQDELKGRGFRLDRVDLRAGVIETLPLVSSQWFEFWRRDVVTGPALAQSSLHTIRRSARLKLLPREEGRYHLHCRVTVQRLSAVPAIVSGSVRAEDVFSGTAGRASIWNDPHRRTNHNQVWVPLGNDPGLESAIVRSIKMSL